MKVIVLGATGQIGNVLCDGLSDLHSVIGTSRTSSDRYFKFNPFHDDWSQLGTTDVIINCIGQIEATRSDSFYKIHVELTKRIIEHRQKMGNPLIIQISALGATAEHDVEFLRTKGVADNLLIKHPKTVVIRPSIICTHRTMIVKKMIMLSKLSRVLMGALLLPKGFLQTKIQPVMPDDLVDVVKKICLDPSLRIVPVVGPETITFADIIQIMASARHRKLRLMEVSKSLTDLVVKNLISRILPNFINTQLYQLLFEDNVADVALCERIVGRRMRSTVPFFKNEFSHAAH